MGCEITYESSRASYSMIFLDGANESIEFAAEPIYSDKKTLCAISLVRMTISYVLHPLNGFVTR